MKVALVYDRVNKWGGAERVLLALHKIFPKAPLYTSVYDKKKARWAKVFRVYTTFLQKIPFAKSHHDVLASFMPIAFETFNFDNYDVVISVTSEAAKGIVTKPNTLHVCICLTPTRYLWSGYKEYFKNPAFRFLATPMIWLLRKWDFAAAQRPDTYIAISKEVARRVKQYYKKDAVVIYPPIGIKKGRLPKTQTNDYFLIVSRLVPYKRIDIAIEACNKLQLPLKIIGVGSQEAYLKSIAGSTVEFLGSLTDEDLIKYYNGCCAFLFPGYEDLGLTILEAQQYGKPVIAYKAGGALETVIEGKTGEFFTQQTVASLTKKLQLLLKKKKIVLHTKRKSSYYKYALEHTKKYNQRAFRSQIVKFISSHKTNNL